MPRDPKTYTAIECIDVLRTQINHMTTTFKAARGKGAISQEHVDHRIGGMEAAIQKLEIIRNITRGEG